MSGGGQHESTREVDGDTETGIAVVMRKRGVREREDAPNSPHTERETRRAGRRGFRDLAGLHRVDHLERGVEEPAKCVDRAELQGASAEDVAAV